MSFFSDRSDVLFSPPVLAAAQQSPLSFAQETMLFWDKLVPRSAVYNVPIAIKIKGDLDREALSGSLDLIISRHEILRSLFMFEHGEPAVMVTQQRESNVSFIDLSNLPAQESEAAVQKAANDEARRPFELGRDLMLRAALLRLSRSEHVLVLTMHHIAADGWSIGVLLKELSQAYQAIVHRTASVLQPLQHQYSDFARWQRQLLQGPAGERCSSFWKQQLEGFDGSGESLPLDYPRPSQQTFAGDTLRTTLPGSTLSDFAGIGQLRRATPFMVMLAALQTLLHTYSSHDEVAIGVPVANRARPEFESLIGCFINMVVVRGDLSGNPTFLELLGRVRETALGAFLHPEVPFSEVVRQLRPKRSANRTPWFQIQLVLQNYPMPELQLPGLSVRPFTVDTATSKFDLSVLVEMKEELEIGFEYNADLFDAPTMQRMLRDYSNILRRVVKHPDARIRDLCMTAVVC